MYISLSRRHIECLRLVSSGHDADKCAAIIGLPRSAIEQSLDEACLRLGVGSVQSAADLAQTLGLLGDGVPGDPV